VREFLRALAVVWFLLVVVWVIFVCVMNVAHAHDMSDPDAAWFKSLNVPGTGGGFGGMAHSCCSGDGPDPDCKNVEVRQGKDPDGTVYWEAFSDPELFPDSPRSTFYGHATGKWVRVKDSVIVRGMGNPTGRPVGCWFAGDWRCFVEGTGT
jgi:hypothetical protein